ncbi:MAG: AmmeMemoRadiSam system protein B [Bacteroidota bacterium]|nr:AmmeMemoRadiSam system protein B [Bacteroidota bacterium]
MIVRQPVVAGMFYPVNPRTLENEIGQMLSKAAINPSASVRHGNLIAIIVPHAGYVYSGLTAAHAYKLLQQTSFDTVVIISPSHREYFQGISVYSGDVYRTPLGDIAIDEDIREKLVKDDKLIEASTHGHTAEHAIEVQLPFLQKVLKNFKIVPIVMSDQGSELCYHLADRLAEVLKDKKALIAASTDLSHYHTAYEADKLDKIVIDDVAHFDYKKLSKDLETERAEACGGGPVVAALRAAKKLGANHVEILHQCNSGDVTGDRDAVVGYLSAAVLKIY